MCHTGQCRYEDNSDGSCTWDWGEGIAPPDSGCFPTEEQEEMISVKYLKEVLLEVQAKAA